MNDSILTSVKKILGITAEYTHFDDALIMHINTVLMALTQMGIGNRQYFRIEDASSTWSDFISDKVDIDAIKTYVALRVKLIFDPPQSSTHMQAIQDTIKECEWRMYIADSSENFKVKEYQIQWE